MKYAQLGNYKVIRTLGEGSTCKVKLGQNMNSGKYYALKILNPEYKITDEEVQDEIKILLKIKHQNIIKIHEIK